MTDSEGRSQRIDREMALSKEGTTSPSSPFFSSLSRHSPVISCTETPLQSTEKKAGFCRKQRSSGEVLVLSAPPVDRCTSSRAMPSSSRMCTCKKASLEDRGLRMMIETPTCANYNHLVCPVSDCVARVSRALPGCQLCFATTPRLDRDPMRKLQSPGVLHT